jgi:trimethylamine--corrinoid protein Co-methyltransferase
MTVCKEKYVVDNEIIGMVMRAVSGIEVNEQTLALDTIREVGPGGHFVAARHTRKFMKKEHYIPALSDRDLRKEWEGKGSLDTLKRATAVVEEILGKSQPAVLDDSLRNWILGEFGEIAGEHYR